MINVSWMAQNCLKLFPNKPWFLCVCSTSLLKILWEKEKLLITSNFSFSHRVFYPFGELPFIFIKFKIVVCKLFQCGRVYKLAFGKGLKHVNLRFLRVFGWLHTHIGKPSICLFTLIYPLKPCFGGGRWVSTGVRLFVCPSV